MERWEQYEIWAPASGESRWHFVAAFHDFDIASAVAKARGTHVRLIHAKYVDGKLAEQQVILDLGKTRQTA
jgi:uncharacterized DUF497 family protein